MFVLGNAGHIWRARIIHLFQIVKWTASSRINQVVKRNVKGVLRNHWNPLYARAPLKYDLKDEKGPKCSWSIYRYAPAGVLHQWDRWFQHTVPAPVVTSSTAAKIEMLTKLRALLFYHKLSFVDFIFPEKMKRALCIMRAQTKALSKVMFWYRLKPGSSFPAHMYNICQNGLLYTRKLAGTPSLHLIVYLDKSVGSLSLYKESL